MIIKIDFAWIFVVLLALKLTGVITWSWWIVTAPLWGPYAFVGVVTLGMILLTCFIGAISAIFGW